MSLILGHRGFPARAPGNSLQSLIAAMDAGADGVEFDVQPARDGSLVLCHDTSVGGRPVHHLTRAEIGRGLGFETTTLPDVLAALPNAFLYIEIKRQGSFAEVDVADRVVELVRGRDPGQTLVASFDLYLMRVVASLAAVRVGWIVEAAMIPDPAAFEAPAWLSAVSYSLDLYGSALPGRVREQGKQSFVWPVDGDDDLRATLADPRVDGVVTKRVDAAMGLR